MSRQHASCCLSNKVPDDPAVFCRIAPIVGGSMFRPPIYRVSTRTSEAGVHLPVAAADYRTERSGRHIGTHGALEEPTYERYLHLTNDAGTGRAGVDAGPWRREPVRAIGVRQVMPAIG